MVSTRASSAALMTPRGARSSSPPPSTLAKTRTRTAAAAAAPAWSHAPTTLALVWLAISVPLVIWDLLFVFLRPRTFPGGSLHWPIWSLYAIQVDLDRTYGFDRWNAGDGWCAAQSAMNVVESLLYIAYLAIWYRNARPLGANATKTGLTGRTGAVAVLLAYSAYTITFSKTVLYWLNEAFSGFANIGHNEPAKLFFVWIIPNGAWIVVPAILMYSLGSNIVGGLTKASSPGPTRTTKSE